MPQKSPLTRLYHRQLTKEYNSLVKGLLKGVHLSLLLMVARSLVLLQELLEKREGNMADDIDDLLDEVEESFTKSKLRCIDIKSESVKTDDLKDLLDEFEPPPQPLQTTNNKDTSGFRSDGSKKCGKPCLGGTSVPNGMSTGVTLRACNKLRCVVCDLGVIIFEGFTWTANTDYLFLRNNYPDVGRLRSRLDSQRGSRAYACQCQHRSIRETKYIDNEKNLKWICGGH